MSDLYQRPSREEIAERVKAISTPQPKAEQPDVVALFGVHARARLAARRWTIEDLSTHTGDSSGNLSQAIRGSKCPLAIAGRIAAAFGVPLAEMLVPYTCRTCAGFGGQPPEGTMCLECGAETRAA